MKRINIKQGFTVIELMLAMAFLSILLMTIVMTIIHAGKVYNRGLVLRSVNQVGRDISDVVRKDFTQTDQRTIDRTGGIVQLKQEGSQLASGRFCLGQYTYLWNYAKTLDGGFGANPGSAVKGPDGKLINFVRVVDPDAGLCESGDNNLVDPDNDRITHILKSPKASTTEPEVVLAIHDISISEIAVVPDNSDGLFEVNFTIGTSEMTEINSTTCRPPSDSQSNLEFCAINQFNMTVRTNG